VTNFEGLSVSPWLVAKGVPDQETHQRSETCQAMDTHRMPLTEGIVSKMPKQMGSKFDLTIPGRDSEAHDLS
jgi:predicted nuclease with RNAse H fold